MRDVAGNGGGQSSGAANPNLSGFLYSLSYNQQSLSLEFDGGKIYLNVEAVDGGNMLYNINGSDVSLDCTTGDGVDGKARVELALGTAIDDKWSITYAAWSEQDNKISLVNSEQLPVGAFCPVAYMSLQDYATVVSDGVIVYQRTTEAVDHNDQGSISRMRENMRLVKGGGWWDGVDPNLEITTNVGALDNIDLSLTGGQVYQMNRQNFPAYDIATDGIYTSGMDGSGSIANLQKLTDLNQMTETSEGIALANGNSIVWYIYANVNYSENYCKLFVCPSDKKHTTDQDAIDEANFRVSKSIPTNSASVGFVICKLVMKYNTTDSGTWSNLLSDPVTVWKTDSANVTSPNYPSNYGNNENDTNTLVKAGANKVRVHFSNFNTESNYDYVRLYDSGNTLRYTYHGNLGSFTSGIINGTTCKIVFTSDGSVTRAGFKIDRFEYETTVTVGSEFIDMRER